MHIDEISLRRVMIGFVRNFEECMMLEPLALI